MRNRLRKARTLGGLSQRELASLAGLSPSHVGLIEQGRVDDLGSDAAARLATVLGVSLDWLVRGIGRCPAAAELTAAVTKAKARQAREVA